MLAREIIKMIYQHAKGVRRILNCLQWLKMNGDNLKVMVMQ